MSDAPKASVLLAARHGQDRTVDGPVPSRSAQPRILGWRRLVTPVEETDPPVLSLGTVYGGTLEVDGLWRPVIQRLRRQVMAAREGVTSALCVNVVYHVTGHIWAPDFEGVRTGSFSRMKMHLIVQAALPTEPIQDRRTVLLCLLRDAVVEAEEFARQRKIADGLPEIRGIVEAVALETRDGHA